MALWLCVQVPQDESYYGNNSFLSTLARMNRSGLGAFAFGATLAPDTTSKHEVQNQVITNEGSWTRDQQSLATAAFLQLGEELLVLAALMLVFHDGLVVFALKLQQLHLSLAQAFLRGCLL
eukprot:m.677826 g.677826  ORF g.677826 m.677826 type:complete len:121 (-) comp58575_c0_seq1:1710-2072(-)